MAGEDKISSNSKNINNLRILVKTYIDRQQYETALFWADKVVSLSKGEVHDVYWLSHIQFLLGQFHRAAKTIKNNQLHKKYLAGRYLAAKCHFQCGEHTEALDILDDSENNIISAKPQSSLKSEVHPDIPHEKMESCVHLLRGRVYEALENRNLASECFREALVSDVFCYEAFECLVKHNMLTAQQEKDLLESLPLDKQCTEEEKELVKFLYESKLKKYNRPDELSVPSSLQVLRSNVDVRLNLAERHFYNCDFRECHNLTTSILSSDPLNENCLILQVSVLVELKKPNELFYLAHKLVDMYPTKAVAWFAVGCYYLLICKNDPARRYLSKATTLDRVFGPAWLAFGHSFAAENEHDQAMAAYFTASQIMKGCHLPVLYIGLEYGLTNNATFAERFFVQSLSIAPEDPFVLHEMGTVAYQNLDYVQAEKYFKSALEMVQSIHKTIGAIKWEPLLNNLGHVCRKLKKYEESLEYHRQALILSPYTPSTLSAMGYVYALTGRCSEAVDYFHKALGMRRDDTFSTTMLGYAVEQLMASSEPYPHVMEVPEKPFADSLALMKTKAMEEGFTADVPSSGDTVAKFVVTGDDSRVSVGLQDSSVTDMSMTDMSMADSSNMAIDVEMEDT